MLVEPQCHRSAQTVHIFMYLDKKCIIYKIRYIYIVINIHIIRIIYIHIYIILPIILTSATWQASIVDEGSCITHSEQTCPRFMICCKMATQMTMAPSKWALISQNLRKVFTATWSSSDNTTGLRYAQFVVNPKYYQNGIIFIEYLPTFGILFNIPKMGIG